MFQRLAALAPLAALARRGWLPLIGRFTRDSAAHLRVAYLGAALASGFLAEIARQPADAAVLAGRLAVAPQMRDGLASWLDLGTHLGVLSRRDGRYHVTAAARTLLRPGNDPIAACYEEYAYLDHRLVVEAPQRLRDGAPFAITDADAAVIARDSRLAEPWLGQALQSFIPRQGPCRLVEIGCGSGVHMRTALLLNPELTATGVELQDAAAEQARANLAAWGLADRATVIVGDVRDADAHADADLVTLHQNIYYFPAAERAAVLRRGAQFLKPGGRILVTSAVRGGRVGGAGTAALDLWGALTAGASRLPARAELGSLLRDAGYVDVICGPIAADGMLEAATGTRPR